MNINFTNLVDSYISEHKLNFREYICQTNLFHSDGTINQDEISKLAHSHATTLRAMLRAKTIIALYKQIESDIDMQEWRHIIYLLFFSFLQFKNRIPLFIAMLDAHNEVFESYCKALCVELNCDVHL
jgi:hypothetical protein